MLTLGCPRPQTEKPSLYQRLGEVKGITTVVNDFVDRLATDERIKGYFDGVDLPHLKKMLSDQICEASGGPCHYTGKDMKTMHAGMGVTQAAFDILVGDLAASMTKYNVGKAEQDEVVSVLGPMSKDIVEKEKPKAQAKPETKKTQAAVPAVAPVVPVVPVAKEADLPMDGVDAQQPEIKEETLPTSTPTPEKKKTAKPAAKKGPSLYTRLGGHDPIYKVINEMIYNISVDKRINKYFEGVNLRELKLKISAQVCQAAGGPEKYEGRDMKTAHTGLAVTAEAFDALVDDLVKAMNHSKVPKDLQNEVLGLLGPMKKDIVEDANAVAPAEATTEPTADAAPEVTPEDGAEATPEAAPEASTEATPEAGQEAVPETTPDASSVATPEAAPANE